MRNFYCTIIKNIIDFVVALILIGLLSFVFIGIYVILFFTGGKPVYVQNRIGKNGKKIRMYKFRSMVVNADEIFKKKMSEGEIDVLDFKEENDERITKFGQFLRKCSLDELPQLFNILKGEMSFIGPRPLQKMEIEKVENEIDMQKRASIKPGLLCYWQVDKRKNTMDFYERMELDLLYVDKVSLIEDIKIFLKGIYVVLSRKNY